ncbi:hypothetical protein D3C72_1645850 [compost metagenome]
MGFQQRGQYQVVGLGVLHTAARDELHRRRTGDLQCGGEIGCEAVVALAHPVFALSLVVLGDAGTVIEEIAQAYLLPRDGQAWNIVAGRCIQIHLFLVHQLHHQGAGEQFR